MDLDKIKYNDNFNKLSPKVQRKMKDQDEETALSFSAKRIHFDHFSGMSIIGGQEWYIWSDGTRHRFREKKRQSKRNAT